MRSSRHDDGFAVERHTPDREPTIDELRTRVAQLRELVEATELRRSLAPAPDDRRPSRRHLLRLGGAAVVGAVAATAAAHGTSQAAATLVTETTNSASSPTGLTITGTNQAYGLGVTDNGLNFVPSNVQRSALLGHAAGRAFTTGVTGFGSRQGAYGVLGSVNASDGVGVSGEADGDQSVAVSASAKGDGATGLWATSEFGHGVRVGGGRAAILIDAGLPDLPPVPHRIHSIHADTSGRLWHCVASGSPGSWRLLSGPATAGAFVAIDPTRVYDSRSPQPTPGTITTGTSRVVAVLNGRDPVSGAVVPPEVVPTGATAIAYNITITETVGSGFLAVAPGNAASSPSSSINWSATGQTLANGLITKIHTDRTIRIFSGGAGSTHVIIDVNGYWR